MLHFPFNYIFSSIFFLFAFEEVLCCLATKRQHCGGRKIENGRKRTSILIFFACPKRRTAIIGKKEGRKRKVKGSERECSKKGSTGISQLYRAHTISRNARKDTRQKTETETGKRKEMQMQMEREMENET